jgi:hypothetical protein
MRSLPALVASLVPLSFSLPGLAGGGGMIVPEPMAGEKGAHRRRLARVAEQDDGASAARPKRA